MALFVLTAGLVVGLPAGSAQEDTTGLVGANVLELFITGSALGGPMSPILPQGETSKTASVISNAATPGLGFFINLGDIKPEADMKFLTDSIGSVWLSGNAGRTQITLQIRDGSTSLARGDTPQSSASQIGTVARYDLRLPTLGLTLTAGKTYTFDITFFGVAAAGPADVLVHFDSAAHPSGLSGSVDTADAYPIANYAMPLFLDATGLTRTPPSDAADQARNVPAASSTMATAGAWSWGKTTMDEDVTVTGDSVLTVWLKVNGQGGTMRGLSANANFGGTAKSFSYGTFASAFQSTTLTRYSFVFGTRGIEIPAGKDVTFSLTMWTSTETPAGAFQVLFGSVGRPAALVIPTAGGAGSGAEVPAIALAADIGENTAPAGGQASFLVNVTNLGASSANVTLNATSGLSVTFPQGNEIGLEANTSAAVEVVASVPADAQPGQTFEVLLNASVGGLEAANLTLIVVVSEQPSGTSEPAGPGGSAAANSTTDSGAGGEKSVGDDGGGIPSIGLLGAAAGLAAAVVLRRRRRIA